MYRDDSGKRVKLDVSGKPYPVGPDGYRVGKASGRPVGMDPAQWAMLRPILQREGKTYEQFVADIPKELEQDVQPAPAPGGRLTAVALAAAPPGVQKQMIRAKLFPAIAKYQPELADKITSMMLEMDNSELLTLLESEQQLKTKVSETAVVATASTRKENHSDATFAMLKIFAGSARVTTACKDIGLRTGPPVDINTGFDLLTVEGQKAT